ncbi:MAG: zf-HC2 domain-containing protein [Candidatus Tectimicrobiota bacterium]
MPSCETIDLVAYLEGALDTEGTRRVEEHLAVCERCSQSLGGLSEARALLVELWTASGASCPPAEAISEYLAGEGEDAPRQALGRHLERCAACREIAEVLRTFEAEWIPSSEGAELPASVRQRLSALAEAGLAERLRRAAEAALGREGPTEAGEAAAWLERLMSRKEEAWPLAALPRDAAEVEEDDEAPSEEEPSS